MKKHYRIAQTVMIPHISEITFEMEEEEFKELMSKEYGIEIEDDFGEGAFDTDTEFLVEKVSEKLGLLDEMATEPDFWGSWTGSYNVYIEKGKTWDEDNADHS